MGLGDEASDQLDMARLKKRPKILVNETVPEDGYMYFELDNPGAPVLSPRTTLLFGQFYRFFSTDFLRLFCSGKHFLWSFRGILSTSIIQT